MIPLQVKRFIKKHFINPYAHHFFRLLRMGSGSITTDVRVVLGDPMAEIFFGYHDKTPFSHGNDRVLAMRAEVEGGSPESECTPIELGIYTLNNEMSPGPFQSLTKTTTWCWQQGCMLQWDPAMSQDRFYYNDLVAGKYGAKLFSIERDEVIRELPFPIYAIDGAGEKALTLNFARLGRLRPGYGYGLLFDDTESMNAPVGDGLFLGNLNTGETKLLVDLSELARSAESETGSQHYINHPSFSPDASTVTFFHIWTLPGVNQRKVRLMCLVPETGDLRVLEEERTPSHFAWQDDEHLLVTTRDRDLAWRFSRYHLLSERPEDLKIQFNEDGHPMFHPRADGIIVSDSYPDKRRDQHLFITNLHTTKTIHIGRFYSPYKFRGQSRCDLHPRWDREGNAIILDTAYSGRRQMVILRLKSHARDSIK